MADKEKNKKNAKRGCLGCLGLILFFIILGSCAAIFSGDEDGDQTDETTEQVQEEEATETTDEGTGEDLEQEETEPATVEDQVERTILDTLGENTNMDEPRMIELAVNNHAGTDDPDDKIVIARMNANENLTTNMTRTSILRDSAEVFEELFLIDEVEQVSLMWFLPLTDTYGNVSPGEVLRVEIDREIAERINWDNFDTANFRSIALQYTEHPAFQN
ncbi:hypothetical protein [Halalkalibacter krulwichiae]|uniref:Uncharacterized protein n=1 Tax=Halalkalibacter krulwichiae TaxID=199441 RepID=A0A1X9MFT1_9BACI|nr:hypothetical protein [Halalkalibacter krulwichiae]ARK32315.1 hypothetical protein BkAM31D_22025 [Halalkalibacter krulwichiae]